MANLSHRPDLDGPNGKAPFKHPPVSVAIPILILILKRQTPPANYLTLTLKALGYSTFNTNLLTIPSSVLFILQLQFWTWLSEKINQRFLVGLVSQIWAIPLLIALETLPKTFAHANWVRFAISSLVVGYPYVHAILGKLAERGFLPQRNK